VALALFAAAPAGMRAQAKPAESMGPAIGVRAPGFNLKDQTGRERSLAEFLPKGKVALVFFRSADW
jgi:hypothetical protein